MLFDREKIAEAEMILVGLGEEFDDSMLRDCPEYAEGAERLKAAGSGSLLPAWRDFCSGILAGKKESGAAGRIPEGLGTAREEPGTAREGLGTVREEPGTARERAETALEKLRALLEQKNYFVVSVSANDAIRRVAWRDGRLVMPCGSAGKKQCAGGCEAVLEEVTEEDRRRLRAELEKLYAGRQTAKLSGLLGKCPACGSDMALNNIYAENYNENGYLDQWQHYRKWLQGTVNKKLLVLELGVGMRFPTVIRWPFEKAAYFNNKAFFCRVNEKLYQLTEELSGKGVGISQNAIDWLCGL